MRPVIRDAGHTNTPNTWRPRRGLFFTALAGVLAGVLLTATLGGLYLHLSPLAGGAPVAEVTPAPVVRSSGNNAIDTAAVYKAAAPGVVTVESTITQASAGSPGGPEQRGETALGSGFVVDGQGRILTNYHVVSGASQTTVTLDNKKTYDARLVGSDPSNDIAVLKIDAPASELHPLPLGDSSKLTVGQPVVAIGNPLGYTRSETEGIISALGRDVPAPNGFSITDAIQTDAPLSHGSSGGPLLDSSGRVIGINSQVASGQGGLGKAGGIGFAVPINTARDAVNQLVQTGRIQRPYLGISGYTITPQMSDNFAVKDGVAVSRIAPGSPAQRAGLEGGNDVTRAGGSQIVVGGDVIVAVDGRQVADMGELQKTISQKEVGRKVTLKVLRGPDTTETKSIQVTLGDRPAKVSQG